eukprot:m.235831 g.235831  ORF g.235831 m.235831 type:complete len:303 (-) comp33670_c4_seq2:430-1338(-)
MIANIYTIQRYIQIYTSGTMFWWKILSASIATAAATTTTATATTATITMVNTTEEITNTSDVNGTDVTTTMTVTTTTMQNVLGASNGGDSAVLAGAVGGVVVLLVLLIVIAVVLLRRRSRETLKGPGYVVGAIHNPTYESAIQQEYKGIAVNIDVPDLTFVKGSVDGKEQAMANRQSLIAFEQSADDDVMTPDEFDAQFAPTHFTKSNRAQLVQDSLLVRKPTNDDESYFEVSPDPEENERTSSLQHTNPDFVHKPLMVGVGGTLRLKDPQQATQFQNPDASFDSIGQPVGGGKKFFLVSSK